LPALSLSLSLSPSPADRLDDIPFNTNSNLSPRSLVPDKVYPVCVFAPVTIQSHEKFSMALNSNAPSHNNTSKGTKVDNFALPGYKYVPHCLQKATFALRDEDRIELCTVFVSLCQKARITQSM
jgi:hypothetical protein